ncbi:MAG: hypothetical protein P4L53_23975 [Candidatus Obscuribacterales bacterium]|nr:hypothetical protein [Candidatus Obscuribacterales bacterium]
MNFRNRWYKNLFLTLVVLAASSMQLALSADSDHLQRMVLLSNQVNDQAVIEAYRAMPVDERNQPQIMYVLAYSLR